MTLKRREGKGTDYREGCELTVAKEDVGASDMAGTDVEGMNHLTSNAMSIHSGNPVIRHKYTADPTALVYGDNVYLYTGHDECPPGREEYIMNDWLCFSSSDLIHWHEHPSPLKAVDFSW